MTRRELTETELETLFESTRVQEALLDPGFLDRLAEEARNAVVPRPVPRVSGWRRLQDVLGGWRGLGGLALAGCAGVWIGVSPPALVPDPASYLLSDVLSDSYDAMLLPEMSLWDEELVDGG